MTAIPRVILARWFRLTTWLFMAQVTTILLTLETIGSAGRTPYGFGAEIGWSAYGGFAFGFAAGAVWGAWGHPWWGPL
jgi:hypothetical protein